MASKADLRKEFLEKRKSLNQNDLLNKSRQLSERFFALIDLSSVKTLHTFLPIQEMNEPDTWQIIDRIRREFPSIRIALPRVDEQTKTLDHFFFEGLHQIKKNKWGIEEPHQGIPVEVSKIDMVIVPLIASDCVGHRVGYGKGFYDKFLSQCRPNCIKIGLSFFEPVELIDDKANHDVRLTMIVTPENVYSHLF